jgi:hypothetical protein
LICLTASCAPSLIAASLSNTILNRCVPAPGLCFAPEQDTGRHQCYNSRSCALFHITVSSINYQRFRLTYLPPFRQIDNILNLDFRPYPYYTA